MSYEDLKKMTNEELLQRSMRGHNLAIDECIMSRVNDIMAGWSGLSGPQQAQMKRLADRFSAVEPVQLELAA